VPGVRAVVQVPSGVAVVADHFHAASAGRDALEIDWDLGAGAALDTAAMRKDYLALAGKTGAKAAAAGDVDTALASATTKVEAEYEFPFLAHAAMEPLNCAVAIRPDACEIWTGTQFQTGDHMAAAKITGLKPEQIKLHTTFLGGGFGRRANPANDFVAEAVHVAKAAGVPVKVVWTREDDMRGGYYRPMWAHRVAVGLGSDGLPAAWRQQIVGQSIMEGTPFATMIKEGIDETSVEGVADSPYVKAVPHHFVGLHSPKSPVPVLWWRSVGHTHTAYVMETMIDELAAAAGKDPVAYRRALLKGSPRHLGVLDLAVAKAGGPPPKGQSRGLAVHHSFESYVAEVADVSVEKGKIRVHRVVAAIDCGVCINPDGVRAQLESAIVYGLTAALYGEITLKEGRVEQKHFNDYPLLRIDEMPKVEVHIVESSEKSGGVGEPGTPPIAPAVANALFAATGKRFRALPFRLA
jgi:isoquinoline 1-oxidoreductase beta subunit